MKSFLIFLKNKLKPNIRSMNMVISAVIMPLIVLVILGSIYGAKPAVEGTAYTFMEQSFGAFCCISICADGLMGLSLVVSEYRERKILECLQVTPVSPTKLLTVEFVIYMIYCVVPILTLFPVAMLFWKIKIHGPLSLFSGNWFLIMVSTLSIGLSVRGITKNMKSVSATVCILYFPILISSGVILPFEIMPSAMQKIIRIFPLTQGIQLMKTTFPGLSVDNALFPVTVMRAVAIICFGISVRYFKWE